jgi:isopentenyldiphosphate isomerase
MQKTDARDISKLLDVFGIPNSNDGYKYLLESAKIVQENPGIEQALIKKLYPLIAKKFNTTVLRVENSIRHAISVGWQSGKMRKVLNTMFKIPAYGPHDKLNNGEFIALACDTNFDLLTMIPENIEVDTVDVLSEDGKTTGKIITVIKAHKSGAWHRAVGLYIVNNKNQVLLQKRGHHRISFSGRWDATCGGHVKAGETPEQCAIREAKEQFGIELQAGDIEFIGSARSVDKDADKWDKQFNKHFVAFKNIDLKKIQIQRGLTDEVQWVDLSHFKAKVHAKDKTFAARWNAHHAFLKYVEVKSLNWEVVA